MSQYMTVAAGMGCQIRDQREMDTIQHSKARQYMWNEMTFIVIEAMHPVMEDFQKEEAFL